MRLYPLALLLCCCFTAGYGQSSFDFSGAFGTAFRTLDYAGEESVYETFRNRQEEETPITYWQLAGNYNHQIAPRLYLRTGMRLAITGHRHDRNDLRWGSEHDGNGGFIFDPSLPHNFRSRYRNWFAELPVALRYQGGTRKLTPYVELGLAPAYYLHTRQRTTDDIGSDPLVERFREPSTRNVHLIGSAAVGVNYTLNRRAQLFAQPSFRYHLTGLAEGLFPEHPYAGFLEVGCRFVTAR